MRICQVMLSSGYGGAERLFVDMCLGLAERGHQVQAICHPKFQELRQLAHPGVTVDTVAAHWDWSPLARRKMARAIGKFAPDAIHSHLARGAALSGPVGRALGIPVLANLHNYVNLKYYRKIAHFCPGTEDQREYLIRQGIAPDRITVIPHFSRIPITGDEAPPPLEPRAPVFLSYGRFVEKKGFHLLIESIGELRDQGVDARLILGGDGPEREALTDLIHRRGLDAAIDLHGWVVDVVSFLDKSPFFVLPSLDEPFGIVVLEGMARGKVLVASKTKGPVEILDDSVAYLFETGDGPDLTRTLKESVSNVEQARQRAVAGLARYKAVYSPERIMPRYEAVFQSLAAR